MEVIIFGAGLVGTTLARHLAEENQNVTLIDNSADVVRHIKDGLDVRVIYGNASDDDVLREAGLATADLVFAVTDSDETNIVLTLIAHAQNDKARIIARIRGEQYISKADLWRGKRFNNTLLFNPEQSAADSLIQLLETDRAFEVIQVVNGTVRLAGFRVSTESPLLGIPLREWGQSEKGRLLLLAIDRKSKVIIPNGDTVLQSGDRLYVPLGHGIDLASVLHMLGRELEEDKRLVIVGGGAIARHLLQRLEGGDVEVTVIDKSPQVCHALADDFSWVTVLQGDATDLEFLRDAVQGVGNLFVLTGKEEDNFLIAMLGDHLGVERVVPLLDNSAYQAISFSHGIDAVISPKLATVGVMLRNLRKGRVVNASPMLAGRLHVLMVEIQEQSRLIGVRLDQARLPKGILVAAMVRSGEIMVPNGATQIEKGDQALFLCTPDQVGKLDDFLACYPT